MWGLSPLCLHKQKSFGAAPSSRSCQKPTLAAQLFDHLIGGGQKIRRDHDTKRACCPQIDDEVEPGWLVDWKIACVGPVQNVIDVASRSTETVRNVRAIGNEAAVVRILALGIDRRQMCRLGDRD